MQLRPFGKSGIKITPLLLGGNVFDWNVDEKTSFALLDAFTDAGFNAVDTANSHSRWVTGDKGSESETLIGKWMKARGVRDKLVVATKVGAHMGQGKTVRKDAIPREAEASLNRLQIDCIDLYQTHFGEEAVPVEETLSAYDWLIKDGRVRAFGASSITAARLEVSLAASKSDGLPRYESL
jgi:aryl-alcohol dehydrogenase-like predicted oxidoreductase